MPHEIIYTENKNTSSAIHADAFLQLLNRANSKLLAIRKKGVIMINTQLLKLNSGKFCALVRLTGKTKYNILIMILSIKNMMLPALIASKFWCV
jgi:hypothetical protein